MRAADLDREYLIEVMASGHCSIRDRKSRPRIGSLPIFSTLTADDAKALLVRHCVLSRDGEGYAVPSFGGELADLYAFARRAAGEAPQSYLNEAIEALAQAVERLALDNYPCWELEES